MGLFDSIKNAFGKGEPEPDLTVAPSQVLREVGVDPSRLKFAFGNRTITVSGQVADDPARARVVEVLSSLPGIETVDDLMTVAPPEPAADEPPARSAPTTDSAEAPSEEVEARTYTVAPGDTLWKIAERVYGKGGEYRKIFEANTDILEDPDRIFPGQVLKIPD